MPKFQLSERAASLAPSPTLATTSKAREMQRQGLDVISFAAGEPDFNTPGAVCQAAIDAIEAGVTKYTPSAGLLDVREAIRDKLLRENALEVTADQIVVSCGAKHSIFNALLVTVNPGDEVILLAPIWGTYFEQVKLAGGEPVLVHSTLDEGFVPPIDRVAAAITPKTRAILVNSPCNPTGAVFPRDTIQALAQLALQHGLWIISDEIYEHLVYDAKATCIASLSPEVAEQTITVGGCSKSYSMTGWRIGFSASSARIAKAMSNLQDQMTSNATSFAQVGAAAAFRLSAETIEEMRSEFEVRRTLMIEGLRMIQGLEVAWPQGAFYAFPDVSRFLGDRFADDCELALHLLNQAHVALVPGTAFHAPGHLRLSYAASRHDIERGIQRLQRAFSDLSS